MFLIVYALEQLENTSEPILSTTCSIIIMCAVLVQAITVFIPSLDKLFRHMLLSFVFHLNDTGDLLLHAIGNTWF